MKISHTSMEINMCDISNVTKINKKYIMIYNIPSGYVRYMCRCINVQLKMLEI